MPERKYPTAKSAEELGLLDLGNFLINSDTGYDQEVLQDMLDGLRARNAWLIDQLRDIEQFMDQNEPNPLTPQEDLQRNQQTLKRMWENLKKEWDKRKIN